MQTAQPDDLREKLTSVFSRYKGNRNELIPVLQEVQEALGHISKEAISAIAAFFNISEGAVYGVVTFYAQFYLTRQGKHRIRVCQGTACHVRGGRRIMRTVKKKLGIKPGETTEDYEFTLERVACLGSCALAPVVVANDKVHGAMTAARTEHLIESLRNGSPEEGDDRRDGSNQEKKP